MGEPETEYAYQTIVGITEDPDWQDAIQAAKSRRTTIPRQVTVRGN